MTSQFLWALFCANFFPVLIEAEKPRIVTTIEVEPFFKRVGDRFEGYVVDLAEAISKKAHFNYEFHIVTDGTYGRFNDSTGQWSGLMGEIIEKRADLAIAPLTISWRREMFVDFVPFMKGGISILMQKPSLVKPPVMSVLEPLSSGVWICIFSAYLAISLLLYLIANFSPCEKMGELVEAGPSASLTIGWHSISGRIASFVWYFMTFIIFSWYIGNLSANLRLEEISSPSTIFSIEDLAKQNLIKYGCIKNGATAEFFKLSASNNSNNPAYFRHIWGVMSANRDDLMVENQEQAVARVRSSNGKYAAFLESIVINFVNSRDPCDTYKVGEDLNTIIYGIALPKRSDLKNAIVQAVREMNKTGELKKLEEKWWWAEKSECTRSINPYEPQGDSVTMFHLAGAFYVAIIGLVIAILVSLIEVLFQAKQDAEIQHISISEAIRHRANCV